ncbi:ABC transporter substrate-binding protein [Robbsia sp. Bb-Pol-6]|uniref:ABC transporter substrate-binding protein n=1 Tax=Robbsia betulipollinis TaxID=2981849 RepID=A0ABT3ZKD1_9BURK|nr:ABC transporter substrate-binding protein [Robbsia betulipollinis]MCY0386807.1 ABC transporter substrate-binding protein [Robbsia betulipollinis]
MKRRTFLLTTAATAAAAAAAAAASLPRPVAAAPVVGKLPVLRYVAEADLTSLDPVWSTAYITQMSAELVYDTLFGFDAHYNPQLQMLADAKASADGRQWTLVLRPGLLFHDGTPVRAQDCIASIRRWGSRDTLGQKLMKRTADIAAPDVHTIVFKLNKAFPLLPSALGKVASSMACIMPERLAKTDAHTQIAEAIGSGPFRFAKDKWVSGSTAVFERFDGYVPRPGAPGSFSAGAKVADVAQVVWKTIPDVATSSAALQAGEIDGLQTISSDFLPVLAADANLEIVKSTVATIPIRRFNALYPPAERRGHRHRRPLRLAAGAGRNAGFRRRHGRRRVLAATVRPPRDGGAERTGGTGVFRGNVRGVARRPARVARCGRRRVLRDARRGRHHCQSRSRRVYPGNDPRGTGCRHPAGVFVHLHAHVSDAMVRACDAFVGYRTNPHLDI